MGPPPSDGTVHTGSREGWGWVEDWRVPGRQCADREIPAGRGSAELLSHSRSVRVGGEISSLVAFVRFAEEEREDRLAEREGFVDVVRETSMNARAFSATLALAII